MTYRLVREGLVRARVPAEEKVSREMEVFYNPVMRLNRDVTILLLRALGEERRSRESSWQGWKIGSPLAGTGVRECRFLVELPASLVREVHANDYKEGAAVLIRRNIALNEESLRCDEIEVACTEASKFLLESKGYDYIELDPFGTPNPFLDAAVKRLYRYGVLGVTATDTAALAGTYPSACRRKYWAEPLHNHLMHEVGLRILVRKVQLVAAQYEKALVPVYAYGKDHYYRVFFRCDRGRQRVKEVLARHQYLVYDEGSLVARPSATNSVGSGESWAGPLWAGPLWDARLAERVALLNEEAGWAGNQRFLATIAAEARFPGLGFVPFNAARRLGSPVRKEVALRREGVFPTHLMGNAVRVVDVKLLF